MCCQHSPLGAYMPRTEKTAMVYRSLLDLCPPSVTIVIMGRHFPWQRWYYAVAGAALLSALAALMLPGPSGDITEIAAVLLVGAVALLAGHRWGALIVAIADVLMLGKLWPVLAFGGTEASAAHITAATALVGALPGLVLLGWTIPKTVEVLVGRPSGRLHAAGVSACCVGLALWVSFPAFAWAGS